MAKFAKGQSGNPAGRPKGIENKRTKQLREFGQQLMEGEDYQANLTRRILMGRAPHMESYLAQLVFGKPKDTVETSGELIIRHEIGA